MLVHQIFARIFEGEIKNIVIGENYPMEDHLTKMIYGDDAFAVDITQYPVGIGYKYHDGFFWKIEENTSEEVMVDPYPTQEQEIELLKAENEELIIVLADLIGGGV